SPKRSGCAHEFLFLERFDLRPNQQAMMLEASLSFLGVGVPPPTSSWGQMINNGLNFMYFYWHLAVFPTVALAVTVLATSLFGDGLRDALDPTMESR
ncbi:MAG: ABC transporter permease subunit, partial [Pseudomonadota bacterium]